MTISEVETMREVGRVYQRALAHVPADVKVTVYGSPLTSMVVLLEARGWRRLLRWGRWRDRVSLRVRIGLADAPAGRPVTVRWSS